MDTLQLLRQLHGSISPKIPSELRSLVDVEFIKVANTVKLREEILSCAACSLQETCTKKVLGEGPMPADIMFIGESPGVHENEIGRPFVGPSGQLMDVILEKIEWKRDEIYITNMMKCASPEGRSATAAELATCRQHLLKEIEMVNPKVIVCWGSLPANTLIHPDFRITQEIGSWFEQGSRKMMALYHPSYILRHAEGSPKQVELKWQVWNALQKVKHYKEKGYPTDVN